MENLIGKQKIFNWDVPSEPHKHRMGLVIRVYYQKGNGRISISSALIRDLGLPTEDHVKLAICWGRSNGEDTVITFFPNPDVPHYRLYYREKTRSPNLSLKSLADKFVQIYDLPRNCRFVDFEVKQIQRIDGMMMYSLRLHRTCND